MNAKTSRTPTVHALVVDGFAPCCGVGIHGIPRGDSMTSTPENVTCASPQTGQGVGPCPACGGSMRFCECMDDPFAAVPSDSSATNCMHIATPVDGLCQTCGCGKDGAGDCPCGCTLRECLRHDPAPVRLRGENRA